MSFGFSVSDLIMSFELAFKLYNSCLTQAHRAGELPVLVPVPVPIAVPSLVGSHSPIHACTSAVAGEGYFARPMAWQDDSADTLPSLSSALPRYQQKNLDKIGRGIGHFVQIFL